MEDFFTILAYLTAGVSLAMGAISLLIGFQSDNKTNLTFGLMGLSLVVFFMIPPAGFILSDQAPYPVAILVKRIFIFAYYGLFPWFIKYYTVQRSSRIPSLITLTVVTCYAIMALTTEDRPKPVWSMFAVLAFGAIAIYGMITAVLHYRQGEKVSARWFILAMAAYFFLFTLTAINRLGEGILPMEARLKLFFPIHLHALFFMFIMGLKIVAEVVEKYRLEKVVKAKESRWQSFMQHAPVYVMELDNAGSVRYINTYAFKQLEYSTPEELLGKNWFDLIALPSEAQTRRLLFDKVIQERKAIPFMKNTIRTKRGHEITLNLVSFLMSDDDGSALGVMSVGYDVTSEASALRLIDQLKRELEKESIESLSTFVGHPSEIIGSSKAIGYAIQKAGQVATTQAPVLLQGETGVGKELFADLIHKQSLRSKMPLVKVNCAALPKELIESELFGHEKGAFTSAIQMRKGRFELADGGTIFLDEVGDLPLDMQPKLLRVLQNGEFERVGGQKTIKVEVRVIAATNRDLVHEVSQGLYRDDLFYRLNVFPITIPPLRNRTEDLPALINYFIAHESQKYDKSVEQISKADMQRLLEYHWPGNIRELKNVIERSVIVSTGPTLRLQWFLDEVTSAERITDGTLEQIERNHILKTLEDCRWKINGESGAAEKLNMHPNTLRSKMKKLGINRPPSDVSEPLLRP